MFAQQSPRRLSLVGSLIVSRAPMACSRWHSGSGELGVGVSRMTGFRAGRRGLSLLAIVAVMAVAGCTSAVDGEPTAAPTGSAEPQSSSSSVDLASRSVTAADFPSGYSPTEVTGDQLGAVLADTAGLPTGGGVNPPNCAPRPLPSSAGQAMAWVATGAGPNAGTVSAVSVLMNSPLADLQTQIQNCPSYTTDAFGATATVTTTILPPSPAESDESMAFRRVTVSGAMTQTMTALVAQNDGIRVYVTSLVAGTRPGSDGLALDELYTKAVSRSRG